MRHLAIAAGALAVSSSMGMAGGIDRSGQSIGILFEKGNYVELSFGNVNPTVSGNDLVIYGGGASGDVAPSFLQLGFAIKQQINDRLSYAVIIDQPFGAEVSYDPTSFMLGNTAATAKTSAITGLMRYNLSSAFSVHGGLRMQSASANVDLRGGAYRSPTDLYTPGAGVDGYSVDLAKNTAAGYVVGVAYEMPEIALRVALTYNSAIEHKFDTVETKDTFNEQVGVVVIGEGTTNVKTPQSINLDFQSGVAADTLVFGSIRWADWSSFRLDPAIFVSLTGGGLISLDDTITYTLGVGRRINENWAGSVSVTYEKELNPLVSPLAPTNGRLGLTLAGVYTKDNMKLTAGVNYTKLGDSQPETGTPDVARADFSGNKALGVGVRVGFSF